MWHNGNLCSTFEADYDHKDEVKVVWDPEQEAYVILTLATDPEKVLHEDDTFRVPTVKAIASAWGSVRSMNRRNDEGRQKRHL